MSASPPASAGREGDQVQELRSHRAHGRSGHTYSHFRSSGDNAVFGNQYNFRDNFAQAFIDRLSFEGIYARECQIVEAYGTTFQWLFKADKAKSRLWNNFTEWLKSGNGIYWINGKAGSGKSTLVKYIAQHKDTLLHLRTWSQQKKPIIPKFFFWGAGAPLEKSVVGMFRSLTMQILRRAPHLIEEAVASLGFDRGDFELNFPVPWDINAFASVLQHLAFRLKSTHNICFILDGLDEVEGGSNDGEMLLGNIKAIVQADNVKTLVSRCLVRRHLHIACILNECLTQLGQLLSDL